MNDGVLASHGVSGETCRLFEATGMRTASIRDQMIRAKLLVERLYLADLIGPGARLLIIGGGAGGITAAMTAGELDIDVVVYEKEHHLFSVQAATARIIDPNEYDWPHLHWNNPVFPPSGPEMPLIFPAFTASSLAGHWATAFANWRKTKKGRRVQVLRRRIKRSHVIPHASRIDLDFNDGSKIERFGAALSFAGMIEEKCSVPSIGSSKFHGFKYWSHDPYSHPTLQLGKAQIDVLVSGAGDGALQDFIRIATGRSAKQCLEVISKVTAIDKESLALADDYAKRSHAWRYFAMPLHSGLQAWHDGYSSSVHSSCKELDKQKIEDLASTLLRPGIQITLLTRCAHLDYCFGLNRWVVGFLVWLMQTSGHARRDVILQNTSLVRLVPLDGHACADPAHCHGLVHKAFGKVSSCMSVEPDEFELGDFDCVVARHGVSATQLFGTAAVAEQLVPYTTPH